MYGPAIFCDYIQFDGGLHEDSKLGETRGHRTHRLGCRGRFSEKFFKKLFSSKMSLNVFLSDLEWKLTKKFFEVRVPLYDFEVKKFFYEIFEKLHFWCNFSRETSLAEPIWIITHGSICRVQNSKKTVRNRLLRLLMWKVRSAAKNLEHQLGKWNPQRHKRTNNCDIWCEKFGAKRRT